jgi:hypothetical protein
VYEALRVQPASQKEELGKYLFLSTLAHKELLVAANIALLEVLDQIIPYL